MPFCEGEGSGLLRIQGDSMYGVLRTLRSTLPRWSAYHLPHRHSTAPKPVLPRKTYIRLMVSTV